MFAFWTIQDPFWSYKLLKSSVVSAFLSFLRDSSYRDWWLSTYLVLTVILLVLIALILWGFKSALWNRAFKNLVVRTVETDKLHDRVIGRCYWIERYTGYKAAKRITKAFASLLRALHIVNIQVIDDRRFVMLGTQKLYIEKPRTIFYKPSLFPLKLFTPWNAMHRIKATIPEDNIWVHDSQTIMVKGFRLERDLRKAYPTFYLVNTPEPSSIIDVDHYRNKFDEVVERGTISVNIASDMDTFISKEAKKFQEVPVSIDRELYEQFRKKAET